MEARCFSGGRLREARIAAGLRPEQLAMLIQRSVYSVHEYERGRVQPPETVLARLADALDTPQDSFLAEGDAANAIECGQLDHHVREVVANFPHLSASQRSRIATLLNHPPAGGDAA